MAWEWSHTNEAYENARQNVRDLPRAELLTILREWAYHDREEQDTLRFSASRPQVWTDSQGKTRVRGFRLPNGVRRLATDELADLVWERMEDHRTCSNGGHEAYACPDGCHTVSFDRDRDRDSE